MNIWTELSLILRKNIAAKIKLCQFSKKCVRKWSRNVLSLLLFLWLWYGDIRWLEQYCSSVFNMQSVWKKTSTNIFFFCIRQSDIPASIRNWVLGCLFFLHKNKWCTYLLHITTSWYIYESKWEEIHIDFGITYCAAMNKDKGGS